MKVIRINTIKKKNKKFVDIQEFYVKNWILISKFIKETSVYDTLIKIIGSYLNFKRQLKKFKY